MEQIEKDKIQIVVYIVYTIHISFHCVSVHVCTCIWVYGEMSKMKSPKVTSGSNEAG